MEVHAHAHTERKKWYHYFWEFLMLFLAVFCGFLAENFREHTIEHKRAGVYAQQLVQDIEMDTTSIVGSIRSVAQKEATVDSLLYHLHSDNSPDRWKNIYFYTSGLDLFDMISFHKASFDQIKNSGSLRYFSNHLSKAIQEYFNSIDNTELFQISLNNYYYQEVTPFLEKNFDREISYFNIRNNYNSLSFDSIWGKSSRPSEFLSGQKNASLEFKNILIAIRESYNLGAVYAYLKESGVTLIDLIKKEYHLE